MYDEIVEKNEKAIKALCSEFNSRKKASCAKNSKVHNTGILNPNKLYNYKLDEKIFLSRTKLGNAKSHGFVILLDWSGSMCTSSKKGRDYKMLVQSIIFAEFCSRLNIPYMVFTYTTSYWNSEHVNVSYPLYGAHVDLDTVEVMKILSSDFNGEEKRISKSMVGDALLVKTLDSDLYSVFKKDNVNLYRKRITEIAQDRNNCASNPLMAQGSTPTFEAFTILESELSAFKNFNKIEKINIIHITDGACGNLALKEYDHSTNSWAKKHVPAFSLERKNEKEININLQLSTGKIVAINGCLKPGDYGTRNPEDLTEDFIVPEEKTGLGIYLNALKKAHNATITGYYLYNRESDVDEFFRNSISQNGKYSESTYTGYSFSRRGRGKRRQKSSDLFIEGKNKFLTPEGYVIPKYVGHDQMILMKDADISMVEESISDSFNKNSKKVNANSLKNAAADTIGADKKNKFLALKVMEVAA